MLIVGASRGTETTCELCHVSCCRSPRAFSSDFLGLCLCLVFICRQFGPPTQWLYLQQCLCSVVDFALITSCFASCQAPVLSDSVAVMGCVHAVVLQVHSGPSVPLKESPAAFHVTVQGCQTYLRVTWASCWSHVDQLYLTVPCHWGAAVVKWLGESSWKWKVTGLIPHSSCISCCVLG